MEFRNLFYWHFEPNEKEKQILDAAVALANQDKDDNFLLTTADFIWQHTAAEYISIGKLSEDKRSIETLAFLHKGAVMQNMTYSLTYTPCDEVLIHRFCYYPTEACKLFPDDTELQDLNIQSYLGSMLLSPDSEALGIVVLMDTQKIENAGFAEHLILVLSPAIEEVLLTLN